MSSKVRLGFIGAGWWGVTNHMPILHAREDVEFAAVCCLGAERLRSVQEQFGFGFATEDYRELVSRDLDAVIVTSPHHLHFEHASAALAADLHVMVEKPMTLHADQAWRLVELARERERHLLVPYGWNYKPFVEQAKAVMEAGGVGRINYVLCHMASPTIYLFGQPVGDRGPYTGEPDAPDPETWRRKDHGGGYGHGQLTHAAGLLFWLSGLRPVEVAAQMTSPESTVDMYDAALVKFGGGAMGVFSGAATLPEGDKFHLDIRIFGSEGVLCLDVERERMELRRHDGRHVRLDIPAGEGDYECVTPPNRFIELVAGRSGAVNNSSGEIGAVTVSLLDAMYRSAEAAGAPINIRY